MGKTSINGFRPRLSDLVRSRSGIRFVEFFEFHDEGRPVAAEGQARAAYWLGSAAIRDEHPIISVQLARGLAFFMH